MTNYGQAVILLSAAGIGFTLKSSENGREVEVVDRVARYYCKDTKKGLFYWTNSVDEAYKWLKGELFSDLKITPTKRANTRNTRSGKYVFLWT